MKKETLNPLLDTINDPRDVRALDKSQLVGLSDDVRQFLIETVAKNGGHFGSNLGVVELTVALHHVFDLPQDKIIWDVGHQAYPHKILTGRKEQLHTIRQKGGLSPFPKRDESPYDAFGVGHSSTSISAAVGMALAHRDDKDPPCMIAVIGDGALTGGMAFEALDHAGDADANVLVILNDNRMSISPNVGAMTKYLTRLISSPSYTKIRARGRNVLDKIPNAKEMAMRVEEHAKGLVAPSTLFEEMGFEYFGPVDGNDVDTLTEILGNLKELRGPRLLHIVTKKGKGCLHAEKDALALHAVSSFDPRTGKKNGVTKKNTTFTDIFSTWLMDTAEREPDLHVITPAMCEGSGLVSFHEKYPKRFHDVGIAEQHAVTFAAGLACGGKKPIVAIYSTFFQRAYDQLIHDVAIQKLNVLFAVDRAGPVGPDGATHAGSFDLSFLRCVPGMIVMAPSDAQECRLLLSFGYDHDGPAAVRYPRDVVGDDNPTACRDRIALGVACVVQRGEKIAILSFGSLLGRCQDVARDTGATLVDMRFVKPLDEDLLRALASTHDHFVTVEDNAIMGGAGSGVNEFVAREGLHVSVTNLGLPDRYLSHGSRDELLTEAGLDESTISRTIKQLAQERI